MLGKNGVIKLIVLALLLVPASSLQAQSSDLVIVDVIFISGSGVTLNQLSAGSAGTGLLIYFLPKYGPERPSLVVSLNKEPDSDIATAEVYQASPGKTYVSLRTQDKQVIVDAPEDPAITMTALDGWWMRDGVVNYNLDIQVSGPVYAMWGGSYDPRSGPTGWTALVKPGEPAVSITVRDPDQEGVPEWELRSRLPSFPGRSDISTNYAERKCKTPLEINFGVSPLWPFVAQSGGYEQPNGELRPPIVVDWAKAKITHFSEFVTVRNQNCSYSLYSIASLVPGEMNQPNFETPFTFYDLSGQGEGYPNLILRTERFPAKDPWSTGLDLAAQKGKPAPQDFEMVRYSWRNGKGDSLWDYKIEVLGFHPYAFNTPIAGGKVSIDAPPYEQFPQWVIERDWPVVTFIDTEGNSYSSNEGIYDWSPREVGIGYLFGLDEVSNPQAFSEIGFGFRGEYRSGKKLSPKLYLSPIDNRLHLLGAEGGLWDIGQGQVLRLHNLGDGHYINGWTREHILTENPEPSVDSPATKFNTVEEALYALEGYLLYSGPGGVELRQATYQLSTFEIPPPTDKASWQLFQKRLAPYVKQKRSPKDLKSWLEHFPGATFAIAEGRVSNIRAISDGFRFVLDLQPGFHFQGANLLDILFLQPGQYVVTFDGKFRVEPLTPPALSASLIDTEFTQLEKNALRVTLRNDGQEDLSEATLELWTISPQGQPAVVATQTVALLAQAPITPTFQWAPPAAGQWTLIPKIRRPDGQLVTFKPTQVTVLPAISVAPGVVITVSSFPETLPFSILGLITFAALAALVLWQQWRKFPME